MASPSQSGFDLFGELPSPAPAPEPPPDSPAASGQSLRIASTQAKLSPAQQRFNRLISRIANLQQSQQQFDALVLRWGGPHQHTMAQLRQEIEQAERDMLQVLHQRLQRPGLSRSQRQRLHEMVKSLVQLHAAHPQVQPLEAQYIGEDDKALAREEEEIDLAEMRAMAQRVAGVAIPGLNQMRDPQAILAALAQEMQRQQEAQAAQRQARKARKAPTARQQRQAEQQLEARSALRTVYRQLASALHPDRETDPRRQAHKTELMSQANAAYERQDLAALLRLQLQVAQVSPEDLGRMADDKVDALCLLLKEQVAALEADLQAAEWRACEMLGFALDAQTHEAAVAGQVAQVQQSARETLAQMREDVQQVQQDEGLKRWLKLQKAVARQMARSETDSDDFF
jgi:hypothetical protein